MPFQVMRQPVPSGYPLQGLEGYGDWEEEYPDYQLMSELQYPHQEIDGYYDPYYGGDVRAGLDLGSYGEQAIEYGKHIGQSLFGPVVPAVEKLGQGVRRGIGGLVTAATPSFGIPDLSGLGETQNRANRAAEAVQRAADKAAETSDAVRDATKIAKVVVITLGVLGGAAIILSMVK